LTSTTTWILVGGLAFASSSTLFSGRVPQLPRVHHHQQQRSRTSCFGIPRRTLRSLPQRACNREDEEALPSSCFVTSDSSSSESLSSSLPSPSSLSSSPISEEVPADRVEGWGMGEMGGGKMGSRRSFGKGILSSSLYGVGGALLSQASSYFGPNTVGMTRPAKSAQMLLSNEQSTIKVFQQSTAGVVFIDTFVQNNRMGMLTMDPIEIPAGTGSGFVWDKQGHIVTNFHVIRSAETARVTLTDSMNGGMKTFKAGLVGYDPDKDIAVLKVDAPSEMLKPLAIGTSSDLLVGQGAIAIGNPFGLDHTLTVGVISGLGRQVVSPSGRPIFNVIQTDASINPGNSGGPLLNSAGQTIGINTAIYSPSGASSGVGFAIPIDTVKTIVSTLIENGQVVRPQLGVSLFETKALKALGLDIPGVAVIEVAPDSPAAKAGIVGMSRLSNGDLQVGDIIISFDGSPIKDESDVYRLLDKYSPGDTITVGLLRAGHEKIEVQIQLGAAKRIPAVMKSNTLLPLN